MSKRPERFTAAGVANEAWLQVLAQGERKAWSTADDLVWLPVWRRVGEQCWEMVRRQVSEALR